MQEEKDLFQTFLTRAGADTEEEPESNPLRAMQSDPDFARKHLLGAPNMKAVAAFLNAGKEKEE